MMVKQAMTAIFALLLFCLPISSAYADDIDDAKVIISKQIDAFQKDDASTAYGFAAPHIKSIFPTPERFIAMVKRGYSPIYRPQHVEFGPGKSDGSTINQRLFIRAENGKLYEAEYVLTRQSDGSFKISAVYLKESNDLSS